MTVALIRADALQLPLADASVDLVVTSPPYFALRSYTDGGEHYAGQLGSEATPAEFLDALVLATAEMVRVLKPSGSIFVNLGDKYSDRAGPEWVGSSDRLTGRPPKPRRQSSTSMAPRKSLLGMPWRYALRCMDDLGLILRAEIIWQKPNALPEAVTDRVRRSHEQWFHFTRRPRYFASIDEIREPHTGGTHAAGPRATVTSWESGDGKKPRTGRSDPEKFNPLGRTPGSVWSIQSQRLDAPIDLGVDHFAAFPMEWPRRIIAGWSPTGICTACDEPRRPLVDAIAEPYRSAKSTGRPKSQDLTGHRSSGRNVAGYPHARTVASITGYACACPEPTAPTRAAVVLDPFGGTGTVALVAHSMGRLGISIDLSADYCRLATWRTTDRAQLAAALQVDKPEPVADGQGDLFEVTA